MIKLLLELVIAVLLLCYFGPKIENKVKTDLIPKIKTDVKNEIKKQISKVPNIKQEAVIGTAKKYIGVPYEFGGTSLKTGIDCSYFVQFVYKKNGFKLPRTASEQYAKCYRIWGKPSTGDLVFFQTYAPGPTHVGIYLGNNRFIHASSDSGVAISDITHPFYRSRYIGARRV